MKEEVKRWILKANRDLDTAVYLLNGKRYEESSLFCQQAAEKALKALLLKNGEKIIKTHDLVLLSRKLDASDEIVQLCKELSPVYIETRYPDSNEGFKAYSKKETEEDLKSAKRILKWINL